MSGDRSAVDGGGSQQKPEAYYYEKAREAVSVTQDFELQMARMGRLSRSEKNPTATELAENMQRTAAEAVEYFGHSAFFDYRGMMLKPEESGLRRLNMPSDEKSACLTTTLVLANEDPSTVRERLIDMRALALARNAMHDRLKAGQAAVFDSSLNRLAANASSYAEQAAGEIDAEPENVSGCLEACNGIRARMQMELGNIGKVEKAEEARIEREKEEAVKQAREADRQKANKAFSNFADEMIKLYGQPPVSFSGSKGLFGEL